MASSTPSSVWPQKNATLHAGGMCTTGFDAIPDLLRYATSSVDDDPFAEIEEARLDANYATVIPSDQTLVDAFTADFETRPETYAPLTTG